MLLGGKCHHFPQCRLGAFQITYKNNAFFWCQEKKPRKKTPCEDSGVRLGLG